VKSTRTRGVPLRAGRDITNTSDGLDEPVRGRAATGGVKLFTRPSHLGRSDRKVLVTMATRRPAEDEAGPAERRRRRLDPTAEGAADTGGSGADDDDSVDEDDEAQLDAISRDMKASIDQDLVQRAIARNQKVRRLVYAWEPWKGLPLKMPCRLFDACMQVEGEAGVIDSIALINFMNHSHTLVDFKPHINFITGINGGTLAPSARRLLLTCTLKPPVEPCGRACAVQPASPQC